MTDTVATQPRPQKKASRWPYLIPLVAVLALGGVFAKRLLDVERGVEVNALPTVLLDTPVPAFDLEPLPGHAQGLKNEDLKGQVYLINFWGSWCVTCLYEHPVLLKVAAAGDIPIYGVAWRDTPEKSLAWLAERGDPYARSGQDPNSKAAIAFGVAQAPESFLVDAQGIIRYKQAGPISMQDWQTKIQPLAAMLKAQQKQ